MLESVLNRNSVAVLACHDDTRGLAWLAPDLVGSALAQDPQPAAFSAERISRYFFGIVSQRYVAERTRQPSLVGSPCGEPLSHRADS
jgi:hypothetical protein